MASSSDPRELPPEVREAYLAWNPGGGWVVPSLAYSAGWLAARASSPAPDATDRRFSADEVEAIIEAAHGHGEKAGAERERGELDENEVDALPLTIEAAVGEAEELLGRPVGAAVASSPVPETCACGDPSRAGVAHRSHECCRIGYASDEAQARAEEVCECGHRRAQHVEYKGWCRLSGECDCERFAAPVSVGDEEQ